ncbi:MAG: hypothetical protein ABIQ95_01530 [Bdellovibrionia bacterium]
MIKSVKKTVLVVACLTSVSAFAISDNQWLKAVKTNFKKSRQPTSEFLTGKATWQCVESRTDGFNESQTYQVSKAGSLVLVQNMNNPEISYSFVADPKTKSFTAVSSHVGVQMFAREAPNSEVLIEMTSKDAALKTRSTVSYWLKLFGYISCTLE